ncbi:T9SS type A sorting domain-containing protein [Rhodocaloribacter sp.]
MMKTLTLILTLWLCALAARPARAQTTGACERGEATADLDLANVRARLYNTGGFFWKGAGPVYNVPKAPEGRPITPNPIFAAGIWLGGLTPSGELRMAAADYGRWEFRPGPLDDDGNPPEDCTPYDRIFKVSDEDLRAFDRDGTLTDDLRDWPYDLGAPVVDGDGIPGNYDLAGGDRPEIWGEQTLWWVMNDAGNAHETTGTPPMGMEVQVRAFAANGVPGFADFVPAVANATFYHFRLILKGEEPLHEMYFGWWTDGDLGNATDDFVGTDTTLRMGFQYNADDFDEGSDGYGEAPPAVGFLLPQGPLVNDDGKDNDHDGVVDEPDERLRFNHSIYYNGYDPRDRTPDWYNYLRSRWPDGMPLCFGGEGSSRVTCEQPTPFIWPGDPVTRAYWSELNLDGNGNRNLGSDRTLLLSSGPFSMNPGDTQDLVLAIVWARGKNHLDSITELRKAGRFVNEDLELLTRFDAFPEEPPVPERNPDATGFYLMRDNYPEPFSEHTTIRYELPRAEHVRLSVHDVLGREVAVLVDAEQAPDVYDVTFKAGGLPAGVYLYRLVTRTVVITRRMVKVRR